jgi:hypothetical protein
MSTPDPRRPFEPRTCDHPDCSEDSIIRKGGAGLVEIQVCEDHGLDENPVAEPETGEE